MGSSSSSSSANQSSTTNNTDRRIATQSGIVATDGATINANITDGGAFDVVKQADTTAGHNYESLLALTSDLFGKATDLVQQNTQATTAGILGATNAVMDSVKTLQNDSKGAIDQKTIIVLAVAGAVAFVAVRRKG